MFSRGRFFSEFDAAIVGYPQGPSARVFKAAGAGSNAMLVKVEPWAAAGWCAAFAAPDPGRRALTTLLGTPSPTGLCVVERGSAFLGDVTVPDEFHVIATAGPVVAAAELVAAEVLLLITPWAVTAVGVEGVRWGTPRIAINGLRSTKLAPVMSWD